MYSLIYRNNINIAQVKPLDTSELSQKKQTEDIVTLNFESDTYIDLKIGDYIILDKTKEKYYLNRLPIVTEQGNFNYNCQFEGSIHNLSKTKILLDQDYNFQLTGNVKTFLEFIVENLNRNYSYSVGDYISSEDKTIEFQNWNALEAINQLSSEFGFDWYLESNTLFFTSKNNQLPYVFHVGLKNGFVSLERSNIEDSEIATVVYGYGSTDNLPPRYGDGITYNSPLLTENRLFFSGEGGESKLTKNTDTLGIRDSIQIFDDIKPERTGTITGIDASNVNVFYDNAIEFDINDQLLPGIKPKINFISGKLIGLTFNISYNNSTKKITLDTYSDESGSYPNDTLYPEIGDQYKLSDIAMPQSYIDDAETRLQEATQAYLDEHSKSMVIYEGEIDEEFIEANGIELNIRDIIRIVSASFAIDTYYEIIALNQNITNPNKYKIQFGDSLPKSLIDRLKENDFNVNQSITTINNSQISTNNITNIVGDTVAWQTL